MFGMRVNMNAATLEASIRNLADRAAKSASREMRKAAIKIRDLARDNAPHDTGTLENAIDYASTKDASRRNVFVVYIDLDKVKANGKGRVGDYAYLMEEGLAPYGDRYNLREGSIKKLWTGKKVGGRFLDRAVTEGAKGILADANAAVARELSGTRLINMEYIGDDE